MAPDRLGGGYVTARMRIGSVGILGIEFRQGNDHEEGRNEQHENGDPEIRNIEGLVGGLGTSALRVEKHPPDQWPQRPSEPVERLGKIDAGGCELLVSQNRGVGIGDRLQKSQPHRHDADAQEEGPELRDMRCRDEPEPAERHQQKTRDDSLPVAKFLRDPTGRKGDQEVAEIVCGLHPGRLRTREMEQILEMLVHGIDHGIAEGPQEKERGDQGEGAEVVVAVRGAEHREELVHDIDIKGVSYIAFSKQFKAKVWSGDKSLIKGLASKGFTNFISLNELWDLRQVKMQKYRLR